ncbi:HAMP domain-containing sensor histidine kinase [Lacihabitans sp. CS3-21]|uniref:sensor histidine kinase n=1 Tax=Lacihabitans sp. CS3-21 TaxID=2487332 RepID=UPI0020CFB383|nr:HAMP domain-containing sensor histidine kinase [Lacihabitans sp. CS3-21]MCP9745668.1 sensor histidine kinase [Lacihabitans sp. CS3-21]
MKTQNKIILLLSSILLSFILVFGGFIYYTFTQYSYQDFHERLHIRAVTTAKIQLEYHREGSYLKSFKAEYLEKLANEKDYIFALDTLKDFSALSKSLNVSSTFLNDAIKLKESYFNKNGVFFTGISYTVEGKNYLVIVSAENYYNTHHVVFLRQLLFGAFIISLLLIFFVSYWFSLKITKPLKEIMGDINKIGTDNLYLRLEGNNQNHELGSLILTFNQMLDRLETSFEAQNNFVSNASHELRTPLTTIIAEADLSLSRKRDTKHYEDSLKVILTEAEKLNTKTQALLFLAQTGFKGKELHFETVRIDELLLECKSTIDKIHPNNYVALNFSSLPENPESLLITANPQLLLLAISNIISNGIKYSNNQPVTVKVESVDETIKLTVSDLGIGIPNKELPYIYDPFFRASNTSNFEGYGIGLPLARNIIRIHKGELHVFSNIPMGVIVEIRIPLKQD